MLEHAKHVGGQLLDFGGHRSTKMQSTPLETAFIANSPTSPVIKNNKQ